MKKDKMQKNKVKNNKKRYHGPLIQNPASLGYLKILPWLNLPFCSFFFYWGIIGESTGIISSIFLICLVINVFILLFGLLNVIVLKYKVISYTLVALGILTTLIWVDFIGLLMFITHGKSNSIMGIYQSPLTLYYIVINVFLFIASIALYSWYYIPQNQGKVWEFNQVKTGDQKQEWRSNFVYTFAAVAIIPAFLTGYIQNAFGILLSVLLTTTLPAVIVDAICAAIYVRKYPEGESYDHEKSSDKFTKKG